MASTMWSFGHFPAGAAPGSPVTMALEADDWYSARDEFTSLVEAYCDQDDEESQASPNYDPEDSTMTDVFRAALADGDGPVEGQEYWLTLECHDGQRTTFYLQRESYEG